MPDAQFALPDLGEGLTEATIVEWLVGVGDPIRVDQPVVEVETAKARVEVPAPFAGVIAALNAEVGDTIPVGSALLTVTQQQGTFAEPGLASAPADESGRVLVGYGTSTPARRISSASATWTTPSQPAPPRTAARAAGTAPWPYPLALTTAMTAAGATCARSAAMFFVIAPSSTLASAWLSMDIMLGAARTPRCHRVTGRTRAVAP